jgi:GH15 family glucan-1,4-alpha-glucosidase
VNLALIGNCAYQALIDERARVQWLCWPRFDSSFVFGGLLDGDRGGEFSITPIDEEFTTEQTYLPNTNIVRTHFHSPRGEFEVIDFAPRFIQFERSFKPTMLVRRIRRLGGNPTISVRCRPVYEHGQLEPRLFVASNHIQWLLPGAQLRLTSNASLTYISEGRPFALERDLYLVMTWGAPLEAPLAETCESFLGRTRRYWETWVKHATIPEDYQEEVIRSALALKLHQFEDTGAITAASTTSIPEYPGSGRNWDYRYCWLRDTCFTIGALRRLGHFEELEHFVSYLHNIAESSPDRLQPVYGISGESDLTERILPHLDGYQGSGPVRVGNGAYTQMQHDVYGEMVAAIAPMFLDVRFRDRAGERSTALLHSLLHRIDEHMEAPDSGLWEKRQTPRIHTFSVLMHWTGAIAAMHVGQRCNDPALARRAEELADRAREIIEHRCWRPKLGFYAESPEGEDADASLMMMINLGFLTPGHPNAASHVLELANTLSARGRDHLLYRYLHHDGIGETHATFTVCGFWYAEALARLERTSEARRVFEALLGHANHVGLLAEDIDPTDGRQWGNFPQTYSHVGLINAAFAISPLSSTYL